MPERVPDGLDDELIRRLVGEWAAEQRSLLIAVRSKVLPETDVVLFNPAHPGAAAVAPLTCRSFSFAQCLRTPPTPARFKEQS